MTDRQETIADIIAEMRGIRVREFQDYADRLEAAHKRDHEYPKAQSLDADKLTGKNISGLVTDLRQIAKYHYARGNIVQGQFARVMADRLEAAHSRERGDCAKLREALETMNNLFERGVICTSYANSAEEMEQIEELYLKTKSALAAPPRNCDRFATLPDALAAWRDVDPREAGPFDLWLFDTAKEHTEG